MKFAADPNATLITTRLFEPASESWESIRDQIMQMERDAFGRGAFPEDYLAGEILSPANLTVLLIHTGQTIGFTIAVPVDQVDPSRLGETESVHIVDTIIALSHRGRGLVGALMRTLESELRSRGYRYLEREAAVANGYAEKVLRHYGDRIEYMSPPHPSEWGPQRFFRIRL